MQSLRQSRVGSAGAVREMPRSRLDNQAGWLRNRLPHAGAAHVANVADSIGDGIAKRRARPSPAVRRMRQARRSICSMYATPGGIIIHIRHQEAIMALPQQKQVFDATAISLSWRPRSPIATNTWRGGVRDGLGVRQAHNVATLNLASQLRSELKDSPVAIC